MKVLADTNIVIALHSDDEPSPDLSAATMITVSALTWTEILLGLHRARALNDYKERSLRYERQRDDFGPGIPFDDACVHAYDRVLRHLASQRRDVTSHRMDRRIAATALAHDLTVITRDRTGFAGLEGLIDVIEV